MRRLIIGPMAALLLGLLAGCGAPDIADPVGNPRVDVDTPALRALKQAAEVEDCPEVTGGAVEGGLPDATLPCLGGGRDLALGGLRGPLVINLFAQWCEPCREEMPILQRFHEQYADKVPVIGIDWQDTQPDLALKLARQTGVTYPLAADPGPVVRAAGNVLPQLILIDAEGRIAYQQGVAIKSLEQLRALVRKELAVEL